MMGLALSAEDITALERRTEGWIAGLQLFFRDTYMAMGWLVLPMVLVSVTFASVIFTSPVAKLVA
jgi:hypothetical protein